MLEPLSYKGKALVIDSEMEQLGCSIPENAFVLLALLSKYPSNRAISILKQPLLLVLLSIAFQLLIASQLLIAFQLLITLQLPIAL